MNTPDERDDRLAELLAQLLGDKDAGRPAPTAEELRARFPDLADDLADFLAADQCGLDTASRLMTPAAPPDFGPYERIDELGRGGIGVVYRARDPHLGREVAVKVLRDDLARDPQWLARFEREGRLLAALNHPNVAAVYGTGEAGGARFLVMELVPGPTLAERLAGRRLPVPEAVAVARQMAEALEAAHERGIIHRDLKPANVKLTPDGRVKVLDFGLARRTERGVHTGDTGHYEPGTDEGAIVGTAAYMSPEQAAGERIDHRSDIWAFGCVLYEMLAGKKAFVGSSLTETLAEVLRGEPDWSALPSDLPERLSLLVRRCLRKERRHRLHHVTDVRIELEDIIFAPSGVRPAGPAWPEWRGELLLGRPYAVCHPAVSPDGQWLAYVQMVGRLGQVGVMNLTSGHRRLVTSDGEGSAFHPCWSPDGAWVYFARADSAPRGVFRVSPTDGHLELVLETADSPQPLADGSLLAGRVGPDGLYRVVRYWPDLNRLDECPTPLVQLYDDLGNYQGFQVLPGGKAVVGWRPMPDGPARLCEVDLATGGTRVLDPTIEMGSLMCGLALSPDGRTVYVAQWPDGRHAFRVAAVPVSGAHPARTVLTMPGGSGGLAVDRAGHLYLGVTRPYSELLRFPRNLPPGTVPERLTEAGVDWEVPLELPDGRVLFGETASGRHRVVAYRDGRREKSFVLTGEDTWLPAAVLDARRVALSIGTGVSRDIAVVDAASGRILSRHRVGLGGLCSLAASPDGSVLYFGARDRIWALGPADAAPRPVCEGTSAAMDRDGSALLVVGPGPDGPRLRRVPLIGDAPPTDVPIRGPLRLHHWAIAGNAAGPDGKVLVLMLSADSYFNRIAVLDPATGEADALDPGYDGDLFAPTPAAGGMVLAVGRPYHGEIWRFRAGTS